MPKDTKDSIKGNPEHGDLHPESVDDNDPKDTDSDDTDDTEDTSSKKSKTAEAPTTAELLQQIAELRGELQGIRSTNVPETKKDEPEDDINWEEALFTNPNEAIKQLRSSIKAEVTKELTRKYQQQTSEQSFWSDFYIQNKDLKEDKDLVQATLQSNLSKLANLPVQEAAEKLADLTRDRILRYAGKKPTKEDKDKKAVVEGAQAPSGSSKKSEPPKMVTLSELLRKRAADRRKGKATAA